MSGVPSRGPMIGVSPLSSRAKNLFVPLMMRWAISADKSALISVCYVDKTKLNRRYIPKHQFDGYLLVRSYVELALQLFQYDFASVSGLTIIIAQSVQ